MKHKYFVVFQDCAVGMQYDTEQEVCTFGGYTRHVDIIIMLIKDVFSPDTLQSCTIHRPAKNKIKYLFSCDADSFFAGLDKMRRVATDVPHTRSFGRLMR
jgi:hypothetical protein